MAVETKNKWFLNPRINRLIGNWQDRLYLKSAIQTVIVQYLTFFGKFESIYQYRVLFFQIFFTKGRMGGGMNIYIMNANRLFGVWQDQLYI